MEIEWIKIRTNIFDHRKIKQIETLPDGDAIIVIWLKMLCLAGATNNDGLIYLTKDIPYTDEMLASEFHRPLALIRLALQTFEQLGMIERYDSVYAISNWEKYQSLEGAEKVREQTRKRVENWRERQKQIGNVTSNVTGNVTVTQKEKEKEKEKERSKEKEIEKEKESFKKEINQERSDEKAKRFTPPTIEEVSSYIAEKGYSVDADRFIDFYESKGWMVGKNKMKDWKASVRTWQNSRKESSKNRGGRFG